MVRERARNHLGAKSSSSPVKGTGLQALTYKINGRTETISADYFLSTMP